ncbi:MAG: M4 family metallopeptidase [Bacteroidota bacterium]|nr:M4 family metallopeptidase [Bacteroidota bacterium]
MRNTFRACALTLMISLALQGFSQNTTSTFNYKTTEVVMNEVWGVPQFVKFDDNSRPAVEQLKSYLENEYAFVLKLLKSETDDFGWTHYRYCQTQNGYEVANTMLIFHTISGQVISYNGEVYPIANAETKYDVNEKDALKFATQYLGAKVYKWQLPDQEAFIKIEQEDPNATFLPKGELVYKSVGDINKQTIFKLCWKFNIYAHEPLLRKNIYIDANTSNTVGEEDLLHTGDAKGTAVTKYVGTHTITTDSTATEFRLREKGGRGNGVETYNLQQGTSYTNTDFTDVDNNWNNKNSNKDEVATDAHLGAETTYDYFKKNHNRNSYNNTGGKLLSYIHYSTLYDNAFWDGQRMTYGDGKVLSPLTCLDICGHELTHGVTGNSAKLVYSYESGALNESFSDIFGTLVEFYLKGSGGNYLIGEDAGGGQPLRSMKNPTFYGNPAAYKDSYWITGPQDNGGVHYNSGVQNHWFYIISEGDSDSNFLGKVYHVKGIGQTKAAKIAYRNLTYYLTPNSNYAASRLYSIQAAKDLYGACSDEVKQVTNAWYAVNVGKAYDTLIKTQFSANKTKFCNAKDTVYFTNTSALFASSRWDFGDGVTSNLDDPKHVYNKYGTFNVKLYITGCTGGADSLLINQYITIDSTMLSCKSVSLPISGIGTTQTNCFGSLKDNGGDLNYGNNTDGSITISPSNASVVTLTFNSFNFAAGDYLSIFDGPNTSGNLIGRYTGSSLPNGGSITSMGGSITIRQTTDNSGVSTGFELNWLCYAKVPNDVGILKIHNTLGRENTSISLSSTEKIKVLVKNFGSNQVSNIPISYNINGLGNIYDTVKTSMNSGDTLTFTFAKTANLAAGAYYQIASQTNFASDTASNNDQCIKIIKNIKNAPTSLPYFQGFETDGNIYTQQNTIGLDSTDEFDFSTSRPDNGRLRLAAGAGFANSGTHAATMDQFPAQSGNGPYAINYLTLTLNLSKYNTNEKIYLDFAYQNHGEEQNSNDKVWVRGNDKSTWLQIYDLYANQPQQDNYKSVQDQDISTLLKSNGQSFSSSFQIRFGQEDNNGAAPGQAGDGYTFDDITIWKETFDLSTTNIQHPTSGCNIGTQPVKITLTNKGGPITNLTVPISYKVNGGSAVTENATVSIGKGQSATYTFTQTINFAAIGNYDIVSYVSWSKDSDRTNDTFNVSIYNAAPIVKPTVTIQGDTTFCQGDSAKLTVSGGYTDYSWSNNAGLTPTVAVKGTGIYICTVKNQYGCAAQSSPIKISVSPLPKAGYGWNAPVPNLTVTFKNQSSYASSYKWDFGDGDSSIVSSPVHTFPAYGKYAVKLTAYNNCGSDFSLFDVNVNQKLGLELTPKQSIIELWPNPTSNELYLKGINVPSKINIIDVQGKIVKTQIIYNNQVIMVENLPAGIYMAQIFLENMKVVNLKFVKE